LLARPPDLRHDGGDRRIKAPGPPVHQVRQQLQDLERDVSQGTFPPSRLALLSLAAVAIAAAGALLPASWAARARPAVALHTE